MFISIDPCPDSRSALSNIQPYRAPRSTGEIFYSILYHNHPQNHPPKKMPPPQKPRPTPRGDYLETETGNKVSRSAKLQGTQYIFLSGRAVIQAGVCIRGDLRPSSSSTSTTNTNPTSARASASPSVSIGRYTFLSRDSVLRPAQRGTGTEGTGYVALRIGEHVFVGEGCVVEAAWIGDHVYVGKGAVVGRMAVVKDRVKILEGAVVPGGMVVPSGSVVGGRPGRVVGEVGVGWGMYEGMEGGYLRELWSGEGR